MPDGIDMRTSKTNLEGSYWIAYQFGRVRIQSRCLSISGGLPNPSADPSKTKSGKLSMLETV